MAFSIKTWVDRISEYPNRRKLTHENGSTELVTVARAEGQVSKEGNAFSAKEMNDLEKRISDEFTKVNEGLIQNNNDMISRTSLAEISKFFSFQNDASGRISAYRLLNIVILSFDITLPSTYVKDASFLCASAPNYKPREYIPFNAMRGASANTGIACRGGIDTNGFMYLFCPQSSSGAVRGSVAYIIQDV